MRKLLLASAFALGAVGTIDSAVAQGPSPLQGQLVAPPGATPGANNNNNAFGTARPGASANPTPGTIVIHLNARVMVQYFQAWNSAGMQVLGPAPTTTAATPTTQLPYNTSSGGMASYLRLYPGMDGMAANGLRYGAAAEVRMNPPAAATPNVGNTPASGAGGNTNLQTLFVRRAFVYLGSDQVGIVRIGQGDGLISLFDGGRTTVQGYSPNSHFNGSDLQTNIGGNTSPPWALLSGSGDEYDTQKVVYLSPNFAGFDFGLQYSPSAFNSLVGCSTASSTCANLITSGTAADGSRFRDMLAGGVRYTGNLGPVNLLAYGVYTTAGHVNYSGTPALARAQVGAPAGSTWNGEFENLNFGSMGVAVTYAGATLGANYITGAFNGRMAAKPSGGANVNAWLVGAQYQIGPLTVGAAFATIESQGAVALTGISQRHEYELDIGGSYAIAPGMVLFADYLYQNRKQSRWNFQTGTVNPVGSTAFNQVQGQGFVFGTQVTW